ncbi:rhamnogalacturonan acetylesterase [Salegentibacter salinarum]|uniref:Rhamnogalacturonan acetylesterase n=1 Tax=Salegentibacter salinarum TaxID=447422 RepID=A0A2N0TSK1_9FLAO|nr:rhamnogalacturonan acetylesterase [Salegentibacter salinarum]PKD17717.1 rhamnogalacturonan acetylesterase [Salegentibacter salinarum]SKB51431.1 Lysophospholipase L1 [Salegentibacter salinarum]
MNFIFTILLISLNFSIVYSQAEVKTFDFGLEKSSKEIPISSPLSYHVDRGYGFDFNTCENIVFEKNAFTSATPAYFSIKLPEGNYFIEVDLGSEKSTSETTIKAESRRLMRSQVSVKKGGIKTETFSVDLRGIKISEEESVNLKSREEDDLNWDNKLTLEFSGEVAVKAIRIKPAEDFINIFLAGDSTVTDQDVEPWASWGQMITQFFSSDIVVANYAASGESLGSFKGRNRLKKILNVIQQGDYLFIEFGHNDSKIKGEGNGAYGLYTQLLKEYVTEARKKGGIPVLLTPTERRHFNKEGKLEPTHGNFPDAMRKVAKSLDVPIIDLTKITTKMYEAWGVEDSKNALVHYQENTFPGQHKELSDNTHFNGFGANEIALAIIEEIRNSDLELKNHIREETSRYDSNKPNNLKNWTVPLSTHFESTKPEGN